MGKFFDRLLRKEKRFMNKLKGKWLTIVVAIIGVTVIEITAFLTNPDRDILDLVRDVLVMAIGFFGGYEVSKIDKYIIPEYKLSIVFGFLFLGIQRLDQSFDIPSCFQLFHTRPEQIKHVHLRTR